MVRAMRKCFARPLVCVTALAMASCASAGTTSNATGATASASPALARAERSMPQVAIWPYREFPWNQITSEQRAQVLRIRSGVEVRYRNFLRIGLLGPAHVLAVFVSDTLVPPDYGVESIALSDCRATPHCKYFCDGRYSDGAVAANGPSGSCEDGALIFYKDARLTFPGGQRHTRQENPCVHVNGRAFGSCANL